MYRDDTPHGGVGHQVKNRRILRFLHQTAIQQRLTADRPKVISPKNLLAIIGTMIAPYYELLRSMGRKQTRWPAGPRTKIRGMVALPLTIQQRQKVFGTSEARFFARRSR